LEIEDTSPIFRIFLKKIGDTTVVEKKKTICSKRMATEHGFTLMEVVMGILLTALLGGVIFRLLQVSEAGFSTAWSVAEFDREAQKFMVCIAADLRSAQSVKSISPKEISINQYHSLFRYKIVTVHNQHLIFREVNEGTGWNEIPKRPVARFSIDASDSSLIFSFSALSKGLYQVRLVSARQWAQTRIDQRF